MAPHSNPYRPSSDIGQIVRSPSPADGVGRALRHIFDRDTQIPAAWSDCLRRLDRKPGH